MFQAISTRFIGPSNARGSRVKATARKREGDMPEISLTDSWDHGSSVEENHARVAKLLAAKMEWSGLYVGGGSPENSGYVFVNVGVVADRLAFGVGEFAAGKMRGANRDWFFVAEAGK